MRVGDIVYYTDLTANTKLAFMVEAQVVDVQESTGPAGSRGHQSLLGLKISDKDLNDLHTWDQASDLDYNKWAITQYIPSNCVWAYASQAKAAHDKFWNEVLRRS